MMKKQIGSLILISTLISGCGSQLAVISSTTGLVASHNSYIKAYNGLDLITTFTTEKDIKTHLYETAKATIETAKAAVETAKATVEAGQSEIKIYNKKYYSGNLTGEIAEVTEVKEETLVSPIKVEPPKVEEKWTTKEWDVYCFLFTVFITSLLLFLSSIIYLGIYLITSQLEIKIIIKKRQPIKIKNKKRKMKKKRKGRR